MHKHFNGEGERSKHDVALCWISDDGGWVGHHVVDLWLLVGNGFHIVYQVTVVFKGKSCAVDLIGTLLRKLPCWRVLHFHRYWQVQDNLDINSLYLYSWLLFGTGHFSVLTRQSAAGSWGKVGKLIWYPYMTFSLRRHVFTEGSVVYMPICTRPQPRHVCKTVSLSIAE